MGITYGTQEYLDATNQVSAYIQQAWSSVDSAIRQWQTEKSQEAGENLAREVLKYEDTLQSSYLKTIFPDIDDYIISNNIEKFKLPTNNKLGEITGLMNTDPDFYNGGFLYRMTDPSTNMPIYYSPSISSSADSGTLWGDLGITYNELQEIKTANPNVFDGSTIEELKELLATNPEILKDPAQWNEYVAERDSGEGTVAPFGEQPPPTELEGENTMAQVQGLTGEQPTVANTEEDYNNWVNTYGDAFTADPTQFGFEAGATLPTYEEWAQRMESSIATGGTTGTTTEGITTQPYDPYEPYVPPEGDTTTGGGEEWGEDYFPGFESPFPTPGEDTFSSEDLANEIFRQREEAIAKADQDYADMRAAIDVAYQNGQLSVDDYTAAIQQLEDYRDQIDSLYDALLPGGEYDLALQGYEDLRTAIESAYQAGLMSDEEYATLQTDAKEQLTSYYNQLTEETANLVRSGYGPSGAAVGQVRDVEAGLAAESAAAGRAIDLERFGAEAEAEKYRAGALGEVTGAEAGIYGAMAGQRYNAELARAGAYGGAAGNIASLLTGRAGFTQGLESDYIAALQNAINARQIPLLDFPEGMSWEDLFTAITGESTGGGTYPWDTGGGTGSLNPDDPSSWGQDIYPYPYGTEPGGSWEYQDREGQSGWIYTPPSDGGIGIGEGETYGSYWNSETNSWGNYIEEGYTQDENGVWRDENGIPADGQYLGEPGEPPPPDEFTNEPPPVEPPPGQEDPYIYPLLDTLPTLGNTDWMNENLGLPTSNLDTMGTVAPWNEQPPPTELEAPVGMPSLWGTEQPLVEGLTLEEWKRQHPGEEPPMF